MGSTRSDASLDLARLQMVPYMKRVKSAQAVDAAAAQTPSMMISPASYLYDESMKQRALQLQRWAQRTYGQSPAWKCYKVFFIIVFKAVLLLPLALLWLGFFLLLFLAAHVVSHPEIIVVLVYKVVAAFPAHTAWAGDRMPSQAYNSIWELVR